MILVFPRLLGLQQGVEDILGGLDTAEDVVAGADPLEEVSVGVVLAPVVRHIGQVHPHRLNVVPHLNSVSIFQ